MGICLQNDSGDVAVHSQSETHLQQTVFEGSLSQKTWGVDCTVVLTHQLKNKPVPHSSICKHILVQLKLFYHTTACRYVEAVHRVCVAQQSDFDLIDIETCTCTSVM